ncbi:hypothetical protein D3C87_2067130 [compost metagenome]
MRQALVTSQKPSIGANSIKPSTCFCEIAGKAVLGDPTATMVTSWAVMPAPLSRLTN